jgi:hypothetical protein
MPAIADPSAAAGFRAEMLDALDACPNAESALRQVDAFRRQIAGGSIFSIQQNVTTADDPADEIRLRRFYSSEARHYPVKGTKRKTLTPWTECLFLRGRPFVGEGADVLERHFDDYDQMRRFSLHSVVNVPLMRGTVCYATFNVFGTRPRWLADEVLGIRMLALAAARWVPAAPGLAYRFTEGPFNIPAEA